MKILLGVTGSVAAKLLPVMIDELVASGHEVQVVATEPALYFFSAAAIKVKMWREEDEWLGGIYHKGQAVPHIDLMKWADAIVIAPLTANTLAKMANGLSDNLLTSIMRAWDLSKPVILVPAMNTNMWNHPVTEVHFNTLRQWYKKLSVVDPVSKMLACGDVGKGAMADIADMVNAVNSFVE